MQSQKINLLLLVGKTKTPVADFIGTFGMPNLGKLKTILSFDDYDASATISMTRKQVDGDEFLQQFTLQLKQVTLLMTIV